MEVKTPNGVKRCEVLDTTHVPRDIWVMLYLNSFVLGINASRILE